jgi:hypothetical protein
LAGLDTRLALIWCGKTSAVNTPSQPISSAQNSLLTKATVCMPVNTWKSNFPVKFKFSNIAMILEKWHRQNWISLGSIGHGTTSFYWLICNLEPQTMSTVDPRKSQMTSVIIGDDNWYLQQQCQLLEKLRPFFWSSTDYHRSLGLYS